MIKDTTTPSDRSVCVKAEPAQSDRGQSDRGQSDRGQSDRGQSDREQSNSAKREPALIERARRFGWGLLCCSVIAMAAARLGPPSWRGGLIAIAAACGLFGLLAIINVALVRGLYRQVDEIAAAEPPADPA